MAGPLTGARAWLGRHRTGLGIVGAVLLLAGGAWYQALITPPYRFVDEQAHAGYVLEVQQGRLPSIDTPIDADAGGVALRTRLAAEPERRRHVWVANNPPLTYLVAAGPSALTRSLGLPGGPLLGLRLVNAAAVAAAVACCYGLARDLAGGDRRTGLVAAGLVAATPHLGFVASLGFNDGAAILASTAILWALARTCGAGAAPARRSIQLLGVAAALGAAVRPMTLVFGVVAAGLGFAVVWWRRSAPLPWTLAWLSLPTAIGVAWFYVLNTSRYGDPTGSDRLFEKFLREPSGTLWSNLTTRGTWESGFRTVTTRRLEAGLPGDPYGWYQVALAVVVVGLAGALALVIASAVRHRGEGGPLPGAAWAATAITSFVPVVLTAQHLTGGGAMHPRYLLPMVPVVAAAVALTATRLGGGWLGAALVALLAAVTWRQTRASARWLAENPAGPPGSELVTAYANELVRGAGLGIAVLGLVLVLGAIVTADR